jgi:hypothetical protein
MTWAQRLKRVFNIDIQTCDRCVGAAASHHATTRVIHYQRREAMIKRASYQSVRPPFLQNPRLDPNPVAAATIAALNQASEPDSGRVCVHAARYGRSIHRDSPYTMALFRYTQSSPPTASDSSRKWTRFRRWLVRNL